jgi:hypothetical protein
MKQSASHFAARMQFAIAISAGALTFPGFPAAANDCSQGFDTNLDG